MDDCVFCKIVKGELPFYGVGENKDFLAFLDINPVRKGHTLAIPKIHARWTYDVKNFGAYWEFARRVALKIQVALKPSWVQFFTHGEIPHAHIHIIPRYEDVAVAEVLPDWKNTLQLSDQEMQNIVAQIGV